jgi:alpha-glucosidase
VLDFEAPGFHEIEAWAAPERLSFQAAPSFSALVSALSERFGRQPPLPEWLYNGAVIGLKAGAESFDRLEKYIAAGARVSALWCEDWAGVRQTSFGRRLFWDWQWNPKRYPDLPARIAALRARGIRFLGYVSPYLCDDGSLFPEAEALGLLARDAAGGTYRVDFGEFRCGVIDFTREDARTWWEQRILRENMLGIGMAGWMADFGEYLPVDAVLAHGEARLMHNAWPPIWAEVNANAIRDAAEPVLFWMRAGFTGSPRHCPMLWAGDQCVDFSRHDGLRTVICGALSAGLLGNAHHHSDIGGYTSLFGLTRTPELIMRWTEMAAFTPMMRTHEGNRPDDNLQVDQDPDVMAHFARFTRIWCALTPYLRSLSTEAAATGLPIQRPLFLHFEHDANTLAIEDQYLYGPDLLVAPVHAAGAAEWTLYLPDGSDWIHLWTGQSHPGGRHVTVPAPIGCPPVFRRGTTPHAALFDGLAAIV